MLSLGLITNEKYSDYESLIRENRDWDLSGVYKLPKGLDSYNAMCNKDFEGLMQKSDVLLFDAKGEKDYTLVLKAAKLGKHLVLNTPENYSGIELQELIKLKQEAGIYIQMGHNYLYQGVFNELCRLDKPIRLLKSDRLGEAPDGLLDSIKADLNMVLRLMGDKVRKSYVFCSAARKYEADIIDIRLDFEQGSSCHLHTNTIEPVPEHKLKLYTYKQSISLNKQDGLYAYNRAYSSNEKIYDKNNALLFHKIEQLRNLRNIIMLGDKPLHTIENEWFVLTVMEEVKEKLKQFSAPEVLSH